MGSPAATGFAQKMDLFLSWKLTRQKIAVMLCVPVGGKGKGDVHRQQKSKLDWESHCDACDQSIKILCLQSFWNKVRVPKGQL